MFIWNVSLHTFRKWYCLLCCDYCFGDIRVWSRRSLLNFCWVRIFFDILIANISWTVARTPINHTIFWKSIMRTFRCIYINCFNRFRFLAKVSTKLWKCTFLENLRTITQEGNMETKQMTLFSSSTFSALTLCSIHFCFWKCSKFIFMWSTLWSILVCKIPQFWAKATDSDNPS